MNPMKLKQMSKQHIPASHKGKKAGMAFMGGGSLALFGQLGVSILEPRMSASDATTLVLLIVIFLSALFTGLGFYDKLGQILGAGLFVPISGFANALASSAMECRNEGLIYGIGSNMFKLAGSVITYGIVSALIFSAIRYGLLIL